MKVCVYGAGAIGGHLAARLIDAGAEEVSVVARGPHLEAIRRDGLRLQSDGTVIVAHPAAATDAPESLPAQDIVLVALKAGSIPHEATRLAALLADGGWAVFVGNGIPWWWNHGLEGPGGPLELLDPGGALWRELTPERAVGAVVYSANELVEPGRVLHRRRNTWWIGEPDGSDSERARATVQLLAGAGLDAAATGDIRRRIWAKLTLNASANPVSALTRLPTDQATGVPSLRELLVRITEETLAVAAGLGWDLRGEIDVDERVAEHLNRPDVRPSMLQDVLRARPLEVEAIVGQVQAFGREAGVVTPAIDVVVPLLRGLALSLREP